MSNKKVSDLAALTAPAEDDVLYIVDSSLNASRKIVYSDLFPILTYSKTYTRAEVLAGAGSNQLLIAGQVGKFMVINESYYMFTLDCTATYSDTTKNLTLRQDTGGIPNETISQLPKTKINIMAQDECPNDHALYFRDLPAGDPNGRIYSTGKDLNFFAQSGMDLPPRVTHVTIKVRYQIIDPTTF